MKRSKFLKVLSSVFGCFAICGLSLFGLLKSSKSDIQVNADSQLVLASLSGTSSISYIIPENQLEPWYEGDEMYLHFDYTFQYYKNYVGSDIYYFGVMSISYYFEMYSNEWETTLYFYNVTFDNPFTSRERISFLRNEFATGTVVSFNCSDIDFSLVGLNTTSLELSLYLSINGITYPYSTIVDADSLYQFNTNDYIGSQGNFTWANPDDFVSSQIFSRSMDYSVSDFDLGFSDGYENGYQTGYQQGNGVGYNNGYENGYQAGVDSQQSAIADAYSQGYSAGYDNGHTEDSTVASIFSGILTVGMLPVNFFLQIFNFEILGINLSAFISAIFTVALTIIVIKTVTGKGGGGNDK